MQSLFNELILPNQSILKNRLAKAAMEENMSDLDHGPSTKLIRLYDAWAKGGAGLIISGNVMIDRRAMTGPGGVVLEDESQIEKFRIWARTGRSEGAQFWLQINHPGRQVAAELGQETWAPSAIPLELGKLSKFFSTPKAMTEAQITEVITRFATTAKLAEIAGFDGIQIHAAHGYLLSQFLSPLSNQRTDRWGGPLENRARLLMEVVRAIRRQVSPGFSVALKLNSADFQRGGFESKDAKQTVEMLNDLSVDLIEISGGNYEAPAMQGQAKDGRTLAREVYFLDFAKEIAQIAKMPLMVTGGIRRKSIAEQVLKNGIAVVGIASALALEPALPNQWKNNQDIAPEFPPIRWKSKGLTSLATMSVVKYQLQRLSVGRSTRARVSPLLAFLIDQIQFKLMTRHYKKWVNKI